MKADVQIEAYDLKTFCRAFNVSRSFVYAEMKAGRLRYVKAGRRTLIPRKYAQDWLLNRIGAEGLADSAASDDACS